MILNNHIEIAQQIAEKVESQEEKENLQNKIIKYQKIEKDYQSVKKEGSIENMSWAFSKLFIELIDMFGAPLCLTGQCSKEILHSIKDENELTKIKEKLLQSNSDVKDEIDHVIRLCSVSSAIYHSDEKVDSNYLKKKGKELRKNNEFAVALMFANEIRDPDARDEYLSDFALGMASVQGNLYDSKYCFQALGLIRSDPVYTECLHSLAVAFAKNGRIQQVIETATLIESNMREEIMNECAQVIKFSDSGVQHAVILLISSRLGIECNGDLEMVSNYSDNLIHILKIMHKDRRNKILKRYLPIERLSFFQEVFAIK